MVVKVTVSTLLTALSVLVTSLFAAEIRYAYDERRQLTSVVRDGCEAFGYGYDLAGNLLWASIGCKTNVYETNCLNQVDGVPYVPLYGISNIEAYCNTNGQVIASRTYSPYGQLVSGYGPPALYRRLHIWFASKYHDEETGLYYFGKRFYSPFLCRWLNQDPRGESGGINLYAFCCNNPVNNFDPDGCAYFAKRGLGPLPFEIPWAAVIRCPVLGIPLDILADRLNIEIAHEQLFFEDGRDDPFSVGWSKDGYLKNEPPDRYVVYKGKCNCQDYADALRKKYRELEKDPKIKCKCKKGRKR